MRTENVYVTKTKLNFKIIVICFQTNNEENAG